jgi:hypothetical protein
MGEELALLLETALRLAVDHSPFPYSLLQGQTAKANFQLYVSRGNWKNVTKVEVALQLLTLTGSFTHLDLDRLRMHSSMGVR